jgi:hypothetical protein
VILSVVDLYGRVILNVPLIGKQGENTSTINFENRLKLGVYSLQLKSDGIIVGIAKLIKY